MTVRRKSPIRSCAATVVLVGALGLGASAILGPGFPPGGFSNGRKNSGGGYFTAVGRSNRTIERG